MAQAAQHRDPRRDLLRAAGPEDKLSVQTTSSAGSWRLGLQAAVVGDLSAAERAEVTKLGAFLSSAPYAGILQGLMHNRNLCMRERFGAYVCQQSQPEHLAGGNCAGAGLEATKCGIKLARKVQHACKPEVQALGACFKAHNNSRAKCFSEYVAFDTCTEDF